MKKYFFGKYRPKYFDSFVKLPTAGLNDFYGISMWSGGQYADYALAGLSGYEEPISEEQYTAMLPIFQDGVPTGEYIKKQTRFAMAWYEDSVINAEDFLTSLHQISAQTGLDIFKTQEEACQWLRDNTNLVEVETGKFLVREAGEGINSEKIPAYYITIPPNV